MPLKNLNTIFEETKKFIREQFINKDFMLSDDFKEHYAQFLETRGENVEFLDYSAVITTKQKLKIYVPNQWFSLATFVSNYLSEVLKYKEDIMNIFNENRFKTEDIKRIIIDAKEKDLSLTDISYELHNSVLEFYGDDHESSRFMNLFLCDYSWWRGQKTINRGDFYVSPTLNLLGLVNVSQGYIADIALFLSQDRELANSAKTMITDKIISPNSNTISNSLNSENLIVYGAPGTGKSNYLEGRFKNINRIVFHPEYTYFDFIGNYKPVPVYKESSDKFKTLNGNEFKYGEPQINYQFVLGPFTKTIFNAVSNPSTSFTLLIEELNRANAASVFGDMFQLLDRDPSGKSRYLIEPNEELSNYINSNAEIKHFFKDGFYIPSNVNIVATMNSADQGVYVLDSAFKRRWKFKYMAIKETGFAHEDVLINYANKEFKWKHFLITINDKLRALKINEDRHIGPYFLSPEELNESENITSKLLIYLWDDVVRHYRDRFFNEEIRSYSELVSAFSRGKDALNIYDHLEMLVDQDEIVQEVEVYDNEELETDSENNNL